IAWPNPASPPSSVAASNAVSLDISEQPLNQALAAFAQQAGLQVVFYSKLGEAIRAPSLKGRFTPESALRRLLENTTLRYEFLDEQTVAIRARVREGMPAAGGDGPLPAIRPSRADPAMLL